MRADPREVITEQLPDGLPLEAHAIHVQRGDLDELLQAELLGVILTLQLLARHLAQVVDEVNDRVRVQLL